MLSSRLLAVAALALAVAAAGVYFVQGRTGQERVALLDPAQVIVLRTPGGMLEVATLVKVEEFGWRSRYTCPLIDCSRLVGETVSRVRVPAHYVYRIPLAQTWELRLAGDHYELRVPRPEPKLPVAFDTAKMEVSTTRGWLSPPAAANVESLVRQLGPDLAQRAERVDYLQAQAPHARRTVAEFAQRWMREQRLDAKRPLRVVFPNEE